MNKPRVLMIGPGRDVMGGISTVVNNYYACGLDKDIDLYYLSTMEDGSKAKKLIVAAKAYAAFGRLLKKCDIVHVHMAAQASFDRKALFVERAKRTGKKIIIHQHAADFDKYFIEQVDEEKRRKIKKIFGLADRIVVLSEEWAEFFGKNVCEPDRISVVYNGVVMPDYEKDDYSDHNVLMLGRLGERKGTYDLLKAIPNILEVVPDTIFYLGGDGDIEQCKKIVHEKRLDKHVVFLGWVKNGKKEDLFKHCSTFILPSYHEGMPMAVLEAMSYGLATISTNTGGIPRIIEQNVSGIRINAGDINSIIDVTATLLSDENKRKEIGVNGKKRIEAKFDFNTNIKELLRIYYSIL